MPQAPCKTSRIPNDTRRVKTRPTTKPILVDPSYARWFASLDHARAVISEWWRDYNEVRPHSSLEKRTPAEFAAGPRDHGTLAIIPSSGKLANQDFTK